MKILITGPNGFIGSRLVEGAIGQWGAANVVAFGSRPSQACPNITYQDFSLNLTEADRNLVESVEVLIHAGAFTPKSGPEAFRIEPCNGNIAFTGNLLQLPFERLTKIIYLSTLDVYAQAERISETTATVPTTLYGWSKLYCEQMVAAYAAERKVQAQVLRIGHVYGPGEEKYAKFLPKTIQNLVQGQPVELYGDGSELRSFIYIADVVRAVLAAVDLEQQVGVINVVGGHPVSIRQVLDHLLAIHGRPAAMNVREAAGAKRDYVFDNGRLRQHLLPRETDLLEGLRAEYDHVAGLR